MNPAMTTTTFTLDGFRVTRSFGVVRGSPCGRAATEPPSPSNPLPHSVGMPARTGQVGLARRFAVGYR